jgi:ADP-ribose pyrophosphatase YjhB (NUDIX family)
MSQVRLGPAGIPDWLEPNYRFCSRCGAKLEFRPGPGRPRGRLVCPGCELICPASPSPIVGTLPVTGRGEVMLIKRNTPPGRGLWAQPGGFIEIDETVEEAAIRETREETGLIVEPTRLIGVYSRVPAAMVVIVFEARIAGGHVTVTHEASETRPFAPDAIPWSGLAFESTIRAVRDWVRSVRPDLPVPDPEDQPRDFGA